MFLFTFGRDVGLLIQDIDPNGRIHRDGRLRVHDRIVAINGISLIGTDFYKSVLLFMNHSETFPCSSEVRQCPKKVPTKVV